MVGLGTGAITVVAPLIVLAGFGLSRLRRGLRPAPTRSPAHRWPHTTGTVLSSTVQVSRNGNARHEQPLVLYAYQVDGQVFQGNRVRLSGSATSASATVARYPAGAAVTVYYDPANPAVSALEP